MSRLNLTESLKEAVNKIADNNIGAVAAIMKAITEVEKIDPQYRPGGMGILLYLDNLRIYGPDIYILWNDQCNQDTREFIMLLRATQMGLIGQERIQAVAADQTGKVRLSKEEMTALNKKVCKSLTGFQHRAK